MRFMMTYSKIKQLTIKAILEYIEEHIGVKPIDIKTFRVIAGATCKPCLSLAWGYLLGDIYNLEEFRELRYYCDWHRCHWSVLQGNSVMILNRHFQESLKKTQAIHHCSIERAIYGPSRTLRDQRTCQLLCQNPNFVTLMKKNSEGCRYIMKRTSLF